ncbi:MOSC domain-containing protein [Delitschia confertaspora ATCC 74209]|uniref:MOSC domain-containing protein n=1 Tax=Delitschia confertaspora ATCC 74209 TaxID=1513339 RepID=A0A9P4JT18_9PLEO|nr:MOSC domain-containing protein [Delitschia confertaspora ATCC 74209]
MAMKVKELYVYPIKSLRATPLTEATVTKHGFTYDRRFMLLKVHPDHYQNMAVSNFPQMTRFLTSITYSKNSDDKAGKIAVTFIPPQTVGSKSKASTIEIPLLPETSDLRVFQVTMHRSPTNAYIMPDRFNEWFSSCFDFPVILAYLGGNLRSVLFEDMKPAEKPSSSSWFSSITNKLPISVLGSSAPQDDPDDGERITFADCASYLITSQTSLEDVSSRLPAGINMDITKFRPNIVVSGSPTAWEEDFWGELSIGKASFRCLHNCVRCKSINIDYRTGQPAEDEEGNVLKKLQKDRRVDSGHKYSPVFGRYAFLGSGDGGSIKIGDEVTVTKVNEDRTVFSWKLQ